MKTQCIINPKNVNKIISLSDLSTELSKRNRNTVIIY